MKAIKKWQTPVRRHENGVTFIDQSLRMRREQFRAGELPAASVNVNHDVLAGRGGVFWLEKEQVLAEVATVGMFAFPKIAGRKAFQANEPKGNAKHFVQKIALGHERQQDQPDKQNKEEDFQSYHVLKLLSAILSPPLF